MAETIESDELHRIVATCLIYRKVRSGLEFFIKRRDGRPPFPNRWEAGAGGGLKRKTLDSIPTGNDGQKLVGELIARVEVREETGLNIRNLAYLGTFRFVRQHDGVPVFGIRYMAEALPGTPVLGDGAVEYRWVSRADAVRYDLIGEALSDMDRAEIELGTRFPNWFE